MFCNYTLSHPASVCSKLVQSLHKKLSFPLRIFSLKLSKSTRNCRLGHFYWINLQWKTFFFLQWMCSHSQFLWTKSCWLRSQVRHAWRNWLLWILLLKHVYVVDIKKLKTTKFKVPIFYTKRWYFFLTAIYAIFVYHPMLRRQG